MRQQNKFRYRVFAEDPENEIWFKDHDWEEQPIKNDCSNGQVKHLKCKTCGSEIICVGYVEQNGKRAFVFDIQNKLTCNDIIVKDLIE